MTATPDRARPGLLRSPLLTRALPPLAGLLLAAFLSTLARRPFRAFDTYFHLRFGEEFRHGWSVAHPGQLSLSSSNDWVPTQWLPQVMLSWIDDRAGVSGLVAVFAALIAALAAAVYLCLRGHAGRGAALFLTVLVIVGCLPSLSLRPQMLSYLFLIAVLAAWNRARRRGGAPWLLIPLAWLWATCHGMWILGVGASMVLAVAVVIERRPDRWAAARMLAVPAGMLLAGLITPVGPRLLGAVFLVGSRTEYFNEWRPPELATIGAAPVTGLLAVAVLLLVRRGHVEPYPIALLTLGSAFALYSTRTLPLALIVLAAVVAGECGRRSAVTPPTVRERIVTAAIAGATVLVALGGPTLDEPADDLRPFSARLGELPEGSTVLTDWTTGSILLWTNPGLDVPRHGYGDVYTDEELADDRVLGRLGPGWQRVLDRLDPQAALLPDSAPLTTALEERGWSPLERANGLVLLRPVRTS